MNTWPGQILVTLGCWHFFKSTHVDLYYFPRAPQCLPAISQIHQFQYSPIRCSDQQLLFPCFLLQKSSAESYQPFWSLKQQRKQL